MIIAKTKELIDCFVCFQRMKGQNCLFDRCENKITKAIKSVAHKNMKMIPEWIRQNSDYNDISSKTNDKYLKIVMNSMSGSTEDEQKKNVNKIISNIAKETLII